MLHELIEECLAINPPLPIVMMKVEGLKNVVHTAEYRSTMDTSRTQRIQDSKGVSHHPIRYVGDHMMQYLSCAGSLHWAPIFSGQRFEKPQALLARSALHCARIIAT